MVPNVDLTAQAPPARIPKLKYRNPLPLPSDNVSLASDSSQGSGSLSAYSQESPTSPDSKAPSTLTHRSFETASVTSSSLASLSSSASSSNDSKSSKKKKKGSVLGFLSLKEPSQVALEQFAEQQRKQASASGTSTPQSKASSYYAGQKLPRNVPKVNSKWDGVPDSVKRRYTTSSPSIKDKRSSIASKNSLGSPIKNGQWNESRFSVMTDGTRNPPNSIASASISDFAVDDGTSGPGSAPPTTTLPEISSYFPDGPVTSSHADSNTETNPQSSTRLSDATSSDRPSMDGSTYSRPHSPASSTTSTDTVVMDAADTIFKKLNDRPSQGSWGKNAHAVQPQDDDEPDFVPDSHDFLFRPQPAIERRNSEPPVTYEPISPTLSIPHYAPVRSVQNFSRPMGSKGPPPVQRSAHMPPYRRTPSAPALPTLYEASLASTDDAEEHDEDDDSYSIAPSTIAPSELSKHWYESPRERLGLGRRLQINDISPWDEQRGAAASSCNPRKSTATPGA
ncbi:ca2+-modulated nonselective cation channel polycystin [Stemphylium lycopersici]|nr:ca2+-modulated nonselective cation channel polycystin [Stemphylium lycopersici]